MCAGNCILTVTAIQNNEAEALRAWRDALDQIYYHNAYRVPSSYVPRTETERALQDSLRSMELQCKERVDLLQALKKSRDEAAEEAKEAAAAGTGAAPTGPSTLKRKDSPATTPKPPVNGDKNMWLGGDTVPQASYTDIPRPTPPPRPSQPARPSYYSTRSSNDDMPRANSLQNASSNLVPPAGEQPRRGSRTPSPEKKGGMLKTLRKEPKERTSSSSSAKLATTLRGKPPTAAAKAATQVWPGQRPSIGSVEQASGMINGSNGSGTGSGTVWDPYTRSLVERPAPARETSTQADRRISDNSIVRPPSPKDYMYPKRSNGSLDDIHKARTTPAPYPDYPVQSNPYAREAFSRSEDSVETAKPPPPPPPHKLPAPQTSGSPAPEKEAPVQHTLSQAAPMKPMTYMKEYPNHPPAKPRKPPEIAIQQAANLAATPVSAGFASPRTAQAKASPVIPRKAVGRAAGVVSATAARQQLDNREANLQHRVRNDPQPPQVDNPLSSPEPAPRRIGAKGKARAAPKTTITPPATDESHDSDDSDAGGALVEVDAAKEEWEKKVKKIMKKLPKGVDEAAAKQIFNEIVIKGDEVHWDDVAGLEIAKSALKETVVYPFLRPDLFMGLREPARGMLLFGPPGTGKTMLARAVATESKSIFFAISASSLTSKFLGESEKLVRALFAIAKALAPSIIFVDEIDSLLGSRGGSSEHEATRRIKTEFLIQWSDLQKAAAGREEKDKDKGDASRVLVLAATNLPWAIDEAARRRFVRRQYIPLPEDWVREQQLRNLISAQKHNLRDRDLKSLVRLTDGMHVCFLGTRLDYANKINRLLRLGHHSVSQRRRHGSSPLSWREVAAYVS